MLKTLVKKQMMEIHRSFFYDYRRNKARTKRSTIFAIAGYLFIMVVLLGGIFGFLAYSMATPLIQVGMDWFYFLFMGLIAILYGAFGSVFNTFSTLYLSKDNELLLSMPIPIRYILISRLLSVYVMGLVYSSVVMLPTIIIYYIFAPVSFGHIAGPFVLYVMVTLFVLDLSTGLGWVVAKLSTKLKNKSIVRVLMTLIGIGLYYVVYFKVFNSINEFIASLQNMVIDVNGPIKPLYFIFRCGTGYGPSVLAVSAFVIALTVGVYFLLDKTFIKIVTTKTGTTKIRYKEGKAKAKSVRSALLGRELRRLYSSATYLLNCCLGSLFMVVGAVVLLVKGRALGDLIYNFQDYAGYIYAAIPVMICLIISMNYSTAVSVSFEGKSLWIAQSLPVKPFSVLNAKRMTQVVITLPAALLLTIAALITVQAPFVIWVLDLVFVTLIEYALADEGLWLNLLRPNLNWTSEAMVVKQGLVVFIALFSGWVYAALVGVSGYFLALRMGASLFLLCWIAITAVLFLILERWIRGKGALIFANL